VARRSISVGKLAEGETSRGRRCRSASRSCCEPAWSSSAGGVAVASTKVDPRGVAAMRDYLDRFWDRALAAFKLAAEQEDT
jgi:hypothetical protein